MKILLIMDPGIPVPPINYGGHERLVYMFAEEYIKMGHDVELLAGPNSAITGKSYAFGINNLKRKKWVKFKELLFAWHFLYKRKRNYDMIHNFGRLAYLLPILNIPVNKIMTYGRSIDSKNIKLINKLSYKNLIFTAPSNDCISTNLHNGKWVRIFNAINFSNYSLKITSNDNAPLIFLSRLDKVKGCHIAIEVAKATNNKLVIAGNISNLAHEIEYFKSEIEPHIDGSQIMYVGEVNDSQKNYFLGLSKAMLFPINIKEAFGMVMAEAMACGTPVIAFDEGAVREVIQENVTGFVVKNKSEMVDAIYKIKLIDRATCRKTAIEKFDVKIIAEEYLNLF